MIDFNLEQGDLTINEDEALILQQLELLLDTYPKEVLGSDKFGTNYSEFLYDISLSNYYIEQTILSDIQTLELFDYNVDVKVEILEGTLNDIILARIVFYNNSRSFEKLFKITQ